MTPEQALPGMKKTLGTPPAAGSVHAGRQNEPVLVDGSTPEWVLDVFVAGKPAPQGSKHARPIYRGRGDAKVFTGKVATVESSKSGVNTWRADVRHTAGQAWGDQPPLDCAVILDLEFVMPRPVSLPKTKATPSHTKRPDTSKLTRSTEDALTSAGVYADDARIVEGRSRKRYAEIGETPGCRIRLAVLPDPRRAQS